MKRKGQICLLFEHVPEGTHYKEDSYSWVDIEEAENKGYVEKGYAEEYDPRKGETEELPEAEPEDQYPSDFPETIKNICKQDDRDWEELQELYEDDHLQDINGVGDSTETKIKNYFE